MIHDSCANRFIVDMIYSFNLVFHVLQGILSEKGKIFSGVIERFRQWMASYKCILISRFILILVIKYAIEINEYSANIRGRISG